MLALRGERNARMTNRRSEKARGAMMVSSLSRSFSKMMGGSDMNMHGRKRMTAA